MIHKLVLVPLLLVAAVHGVFVSSQDSCSNLSPTITFVTTCKTINVNDPQCFTPSRAPNNDDVLLFPKGTSAAVAFSYLYTPLIAGSIIIDAGATVTLNGGGFETINCFVVKGQLDLVAPNEPDSGSASTVPFRGDGSVPQQTDCLLVNQGFTPRVCGPGKLIVTGTVNVNGLYASLWATTSVRATGVVTTTDGAFLWANISNAGTIRSTGRLYLHGNIHNMNSLNVQIVRTDIWADNSYSLASVPSVIIENDANIVFDQSHGNGFDVVSTSIEYWDPATLATRFKLINNKPATLTFLCVVVDTYNGCQQQAGTDFNIFNFGTILWHATGQYQGFYFISVGSTVNMGTMISNGTYVSLSDYLSDGGVLKTYDNGGFNFGNGAGVDTKTAVLCKKDSAAKAPRETPFKKEITTSHVNQTSIKCDPTVYNSCAFPLCCGASGVCETARCQNADGYGGGAMCCQDNDFCGGSSHGPYCGGGIFSWEVDTECLDELKYVDRYEYDFMRQHFSLLDLPTFGKHRYSFRGDSSISGDATGFVKFTEPVEVTGSLTVSVGGNLVSLVESGGSPFAGKGSVLIQGRHAAGVKSSYKKGTRMAVVAGGRFVVPSFGLTMLHSNADVQLEKGSVLQVDGRLVYTQEEGVSKVTLRACGELRGNGGVIGEDLPCAK